MAENNKPMPIQYRMSYVPERKTVLIWVSSAAMFEMPFDVFKQFYYEADKQQKAAQSNLLVPDKRIVTPDEMKVK